MYRIRIVKERYKLVSSSLNGVVTFASRPILVSREQHASDPVPHVTPSLVEEINRLRCRISYVVPSTFGCPRILLSVMVQLCFLTYLQNRFSSGMHPSTVKSAPCTVTHNSLFFCCRSCMATVGLAGIPSIPPTDMRFPPPSTWWRLSCRTSLVGEAGQPIALQVRATLAAILLRCAPALDS